MSTSADSLPSQEFFPTDTMSTESDAISSLIQLQDNVLSCKDCPELVKCRSRPVPGYGDKNPHILFVGEAPGRLGADVTGVPFTKDRSGKLFQKMLGHIGLTRSPPDDPFPDLHKAYVTNIVKCNPRDDAGRNRPPSQQEKKNCRKHLIEEIRLLSPRIIVPLGVAASQQIIGDEFKPEDFGRIFNLDNVIIFPLWHPGYVVRGGGKARLTERKYRKNFLKLKILLDNIDPDFIPAEPACELSQFRSSASM